MALFYDSWPPFQRYPSFFDSQKKLQRAKTRTRFSQHKQAESQIKSFDLKLNKRTGVITEISPQFMAARTHKNDT